MFQKFFYRKFSRKHFSSLESIQRNHFIKDNNPNEEIIISNYPYIEKLSNDFKKMPNNLIIVSGN